MRGIDQYASVSSLDDYGCLSLRGTTNKCGAFGFDDCDPVTANARVLTQDEGKQLFETRRASSYGARYCPATFPTGAGKVFTTNFVLGTDTCDQTSDFIKQFPWIVAALKLSSSS